jgi:predicted small lipoprotein YifL
MNWHRRLAALFVVLALASCAQGPASYPPENKGNMPEHGGGDGGGGGGGSM